MMMNEDCGGHLENQESVELIGCMMAVEDEKEYVELEVVDAKLTVAKNSKPNLYCR